MFGPPAWPIDMQTHSNRNQSHPAEGVARNMKTIREPLRLSVSRRLGFFFVALLNLVILPPGVCFTSVSARQAHDEVLALTPPMGWNSWNRFRLNINDALIRAQAEALVKSGMKAAGYEHVVIDGGWQGYHDVQGAFRPNKFKFPDMKALCDYIHSLGLKVGIHTTPGPMTCSGREGSYGYENEDAKTFARWGIDFLKYDWCSGSLVYMPGHNLLAYEKMHQAIPSADRPMIHNLCQYGMEDVWKWGASVGGHMWRTTEDILDGSVANRGRERRW
jgi:alpha-galactosidase